MLDFPAPFQLYEASVPFSVWLNSLGLVNDELMAELVALMIYLMGKSELIAARQTYWVELVFILKTATQALIGNGS